MLIETKWLLASPEVSARRSEELAQRKATYIIPSNLYLSCNA